MPRKKSQQNLFQKLYSRLYADYKRYPKEAELVQAALGTFGFTEVGLPYPLTAKYHMNLCGLKTCLTARNRKGEELTPYAKSCMRQIKLFTDALETWVAHLS